MARLKSGSKISHFSILSNESTSTHITENYNFLLRTNIEQPGVVLLTEADANLETEDSLTINGEDLVNLTPEITTISFVADELPTPNAVSGVFKSS